MTRVIKLLSVVVLCFFSGAIYADPTSDELTQLLNNIRSMQANFNQTVQDTKGRTISYSQGRMALQRPGKFRWDTIKPNPQLIVTNGKRVWIYDADLEQLTIRYLTKEAGETPALLLSSVNATLDKDFRVQASNENGTTKWFVLRPKDKSSIFAMIRLGFQKNEITQMQLQDHLDHVTLIRFSRIVINPTLSDSAFTFKPPAHVDVIDETKR
ncbi:MAG: outer membrane lipoprotein chaperone LolA [Gammaproteobacteria bacterium]